MWPALDAAVPPNGYAWWYIDAVSDGGKDALTLIAFVGSVFSPYYARARRRGSADPFDHCALNVALYGNARRWTMTERGRKRVRRDGNALHIGPSRVSWHDARFVADIDEISVPFPARVRGRVQVTPIVRCARSWCLDASGLHRWQPLAPVVRVEVDLQAPEVHWSGTGYLDTNCGDEPLENGFAGWHWARTPLPGDRTIVTYELHSRAGKQRGLGVDIDAQGTPREFVIPESTVLPATLWRVERRAHCGWHAARLEKTLEDTPFYARSLLASTICGERALTIHESLSLERFRSRWVQMLLPFRMPRAAR